MAATATRIDGVVSGYHGGQKGPQWRTDSLLQPAPAHQQNKATPTPDSGWCSIPVRPPRPLHLQDECNRCKTLFLYQLESVLLLVTSAGMYCVADKRHFCLRVKWTKWLHWLLACRHGTALLRMLQRGTGNWWGLYSHKTSRWLKFATQTTGVSAHALEA